MNYKLKEEEKFTYLEVGEGPVLLLLHGLFGALSNWASVIETFRDRYTIAIPLLPIYGSVLRRPTVKSLAEYVDDFVEYKGYKDPIMIGNSLGGHVGLVYALECSDNYKAMVLTGSSGLFEHGLGGSFPRLNDRDYLKERIQYTFYDPATATDELIDEVVSLVNDRLKVLKIISMSKSAMKHNVGDDLHKLEKPFGIIWGKDDKITPPEVAEEFNKRIKNSKLYFIDKCGHAPMMERPEEFNTAFEDYLESLD